MALPDVSPRCQANLHVHCQETSATCGCQDCHFGPCVGCGDDNLLRIYDGLCAPCERVRVRSGARPVQACDRCGQGPGHRNPRHRRNEYLCKKCHADDGETLVVPASVMGAVLAGDCRTLDVTDPAHRWVHVKGTKFVCDRCGVKKFDAAARKAMRNDRV